jgi:hypothetical protein
LGVVLVGFINSWIIGWIAGGAAVVVVVVLLLVATWMASRVAAKAEAILIALNEARANTEGLWGVAELNATAQRVVKAASAARSVLEGDRGEL